MLWIVQLQQTCIILLRKQMKAEFRKPLIVFTPKSLLRHPMVVSSVDEFANGSFQMLNDDNDVEVKNVKTLVFVTGKFYYDLSAETIQVKAR